MWPISYTTGLKSPSGFKNSRRLRRLQAGRGHPMQNASNRRRLRPGSPVHSYGAKDGLKLNIICWIDAVQSLPPSPLPP